MIDLHTHSTASDGTDLPADLVRRAAGLGVTVLALTDHDTTAGWAEAAEALPAALRLVRGAEISCTREGISLHLLAYLFDPADQALAEELRLIRDSRERRAERMVERLLADGVPVTVQADGVVGRPHVAKALVDAGVVPSIEDAFSQDWIGTGGRYWVGRRELDAVEAIRLVTDAGGVVVFAHPGAAARGETVGDHVIEELAEVGMAGIEVDHIDHPADTRVHLRDVARSLDLVVTGASDFHGAHKEVELAAFVTDPSSYADLFSRDTALDVL